MIKTDLAIDTITIAGGGLAGWMSALYLSSFFSNKKQKLCKISVVDCTIADSLSMYMIAPPHFNKYLARLGMSEEEFMNFCEGTFHSGKKYQNWNDNPNDYFWDTFKSVHLNNSYGVGIHQVWYASQQNKKEKISFSKACHEAVTLIEKNRCPRTKFDQGGLSLPSGYHINTLKLLHLLKEKSISNGVSLINSEISEVKTSSSGKIDHIKLENGEFQKADLFIDCTGRKRTLMRSLGCEIIGTSEVIDSFVSVEMRYHDEFNEKNNYELRPYSNISANNCGWVVDMDLRWRRYLSYYYDSSLLSSSDAVSELKNSIGHEKCTVIQTGAYQQEYLNKSWIENCVAVGVSSGKVGSFFANDIDSIITSLDTLYSYFPDREFDIENTVFFNKELKNFYSSVIDIEFLLYYLSDKAENGFWQNPEKLTKVSDRTTQMLKRVSLEWTLDHNWFHPYISPFSVVTLLAGMKRYPQKLKPILLYAENVGSKLTGNLEKLQNVSKDLPSQVEYFKHLNEIKLFKENEDW